MNGGIGEGTGKGAERDTKHGRKGKALFARKGLKTKGATYKIIFLKKAVTFNI